MHNLASPRRGAIAVLLAALCVVSSTAFAAEPEPFDLPAHLSAHVSIRDPHSLISHIDEYVANATLGTANAVPAGLIIMLTQMYMPIPFDIWYADSDLHILFLKTPLPGAQGIVAVFSAESYDAFVEGLADAGAEVEPRDGEALPVLPGASALVKMQGMGNVAVLELPDGRVALAQRPEALGMAFAKNDWLPADHGGDADVSVVFSVSASGSMAGMFRRSLAHDMASAVDKLGENGFDPDIAENLGVGFSQLVEKIVDQLALLRHGTVDVRLDGDWALTRFRGDWEKDALATEVAAALTGKKNVDLPLAERVGRDAVSFSINAAVNSMLADSDNRMAALIAGVFAPAFPEKAETLRRHMVEASALSNTDNALANYASGDRQWNAFWFQASDAAALDAAMSAVFADLNDMLEAAVVEPGYKIRFEPEKGEADGIAYTRYKLVFADWDKIADAIGDITDSAPSSKKLLENIENYSVFLAVRDGVALVASGSVDADQYAAMWRHDAEQSLVRSPAVREMLSRLELRQAAFGFVSVDKIFAIVAKEMAEMENRYYGIGESPNLKVLARMLPRMEETGEGVGFSGGVENGRCVVDWAMPASAINAVLRHYDLWERTKKEIGSEKPAPVEEPAPEEEPVEAS